jgi:hypothetical protein
MAKEEFFTFSGIELNNLKASSQQWKVTLLFL